MSSDKMQTAPVDPRFSTTVDQFKHCWTVYNEFLKCSKRFGMSNDKCQTVWSWTQSMCPESTLQQFYEARRDDKWYGYDFPLQQEELKEGDEIVVREKHTHDHH